MGAYTNEDLAYHPAYSRMVGFAPPDSFVSNGASWAPDVFLGTDVTPAAHWHDYGYSRKSPGLHTEQSRYWRDQEFLSNLRTCGLGSCVAHAYYFRVRLFGHRHYQYDPGQEPKRTLRFWLRLFFGRYLRW